MASDEAKEIVERRHGEPISAQNGPSGPVLKTKLVMNYELLLRAFFHVFMGKNLIL